MRQPFGPLRDWDTRRSSSLECGDLWPVLKALTSQRTPNIDATNVGGVRLRGAPYLVTVAMLFADPRRTKEMTEMTGPQNPNRPMGLERTNANFEAITEEIEIATETGPANASALCTGSDRDGWR